MAQPKIDLSKLTTEARNEATRNIDKLRGPELARLINQEDHKCPEAVAQCVEHIGTAIEVIADRVRNGGRLVYIGAGTSGRLGVLDASECPPTFNAAPGQIVGLIAGGEYALQHAVEGAEDDAAQGVQDVKGIGFSNKDVLCGIAASGRTPYVIGAMKYAQSIGAYTIAVTCNAAAEMNAHADCPISPVVGPEVVTGSTRLKSGTATKLVLNMLTTGTFIRVGKTYGNLMVDVQSTNLKLIERSKNIVRMVTEADDATAAARLAEAQGEVKTAIVMHMRGVSADQARQLLEDAKGLLRDAIETGVPATPDQLAAMHARRESVVAKDLYLGVDGGGTKVAAVLGQLDHNGTMQVIGQGLSGPANPQTVGWDNALHNIEECMSLAFQAAGLPIRKVEGCVVGLAGGAREAVQHKMIQWNKDKNIAKHFVATNDALPILHAAEGAMVGLIAGTGSIAFGLNAKGEFVRSGGWGPLMGDEGSGYKLALSALESTMRAHDGRIPPTAISSKVLKILGAKQAPEIVTVIYEHKDDRGWLGQFAACVLEAAEEEDALANQLLGDATAQLATLVKNVKGKVGTMKEGESYKLAVAGGVLSKSKLYRAKLESALSKAGENAVEVHIIDFPAMGCLAMAQKAAASA